MALRAWRVGVYISGDNLGMNAIVAHRCFKCVRHRATLQKPLQTVDMGLALIMCAHERHRRSAQLNPTPTPRF